MQKQQESHTNKQTKGKLLGPCATIFSSEKTGSWRLSRPHINLKKCIKCGTCVMFCPVNVIDINHDREAGIRIDYDYCKGCGICANECPVQCIQMIPERGNSNGI